MRVIRFNRNEEKDKHLYELVNLWWEIKDGNPMPKLIASDFGFLAFDENDKPIAANFFYPILGTEACMWALHVSSPESTKENRGLAITALCNEVEKFAKSLGYKIIVGYPKQESMTNRMINNGFILTESGANQCVKRL